MGAAALYALRSHALPSLDLFRANGIVGTFPIYIHA